MSPTKWTVVTTDITGKDQSNPVLNTWYNDLSIALPIGCWRVYYEVMIYGIAAAPGYIVYWTTLSTANNSETDIAFTGFGIMAAVTDASSTIHREKIIECTAKATYYLNKKASAGQLTHLYTRGDVGTTYIKAVCSYL